MFFWRRAHWCDVERIRRGSNARKMSPYANRRRPVNVQIGGIREFPLVSGSGIACDIHVRKASRRCGTKVYAYDTVAPLAGELCEARN